MKKTILMRVVFACVLSQCLFVFQVTAGTLIFSSDFNISDNLDGSAPGGGNVTLGNQILFDNILSSAAEGARVHVSGSSSFQDSIDNIYNYYGLQSGVAATTSSDVGFLFNQPLVDTLDLVVMVGGLNDESNRIDPLLSMLGRGATVFYLEEFNTSPTNDVLSALGSTMTVNNNVGSKTGGSTSSIGSDPLMSGVTSLYAQFYGSVSGGTPLAFTSSGSRPFIAYEEITTVPVPAAVWLFGSGLLGLVGVARRKMRS